MARTLSISIRGTLALAIATLALVALLSASPSVALAGGKCPNSNALPTKATSDQLEDAVLCLIAKERRERDRKPVERNRALSGVAERHTDVMLKEDCLRHECKGEDSLEDRIRRSDYPRPGERFAFAEVTGCDRTPQMMVDEWMGSPAHRDRILGRRYRDVGIGARKGRLDREKCDRFRGIYTVIFAWR